MRNRMGYIYLGVNLDEHRLHLEFSVNTTGNFSRFDQALEVIATCSGEPVTPKN